MRSFEDTYSFRICTILFYFFRVISTSYMIKNMNFVVRFFVTNTAILLNFALTRNLHIQLAVGNTLLNVLGKLAFEVRLKYLKII